MNPTINYISSLLLPLYGIHTHTHKWNLINFMAKINMKLRRTDEFHFILTQFEVVIKTVIHKNTLEIHFACIFSGQISSSINQTATTTIVRTTAIQKKIYVFFIYVVGMLWIDFVKIVVISSRSMQFDRIYGQVAI